MSESMFIKRIEMGVFNEISEHTVNDVLCDLTGKTALFYAVHYQRNDTVRRLLEAGASLSCKDKFGKTPLDYASHSTMLCIQEFTSTEMKSLARENDKMVKESKNKKRKLDEIYEENSELKKTRTSLARENKRLLHTIESKEADIDALAEEKKTMKHNLDDSRKAFMELRRSMSHSSTTK